MAFSHFGKINNPGITIFHKSTKIVPDSPVLFGTAAAGLFGTGFLFIKLIGIFQRNSRTARQLLTKIFHQSYCIFLSNQLFDKFSFLLLISKRSPLCGTPLTDSTISLIVFREVIVVFRSFAFAGFSLFDTHEWPPSVCFRFYPKITFMGSHVKQ